MEGYQKKIAIVTHQMVMGGIEKSLIELCKALQKKNIQVTIYLEAKGGELYSAIPKGVKIVSIFDDYNNMKHAISNFLIRGEISKAYALGKTYVINKLKLDPVKGWRETIKYLKEEQEHYDYAFAYGAPIAFSTFYVIEKINADKKYAWIHSDPEQLSLNIKKYKKSFERYDKIICVSRAIQKKIEKIFPEYSLKCRVFYNIINKNEIIKKSKELIEKDDFDGKRLLTVGRLSDEKGQDIIPKIAKKLLDENYNIRWYCIGEGELHSQLNSLIEKEKLQGKVILLGNKNNPYPYFKISDIYVQTSRHEGFGITLTEAKIMNLPVVTTDFSGAFEQIDEGKTGLVVKFDTNDIYMAVKKLLDNDKLVNDFKENLKRDKKKCVSNINELITLEEE